MTQYPETLDLSSVSTLIEIVKNRQILERKEEFGLNGWNVQGYLQKIFLGSPGSMYAHSGELQKGLEDLEATLNEYESGSQSFTASNEKETKDIGTVILIVSTILNLLKALGFLKKNREATYYGVSGAEPAYEEDFVAADFEDVDHDEDVEVDN